MHPTYRSTHRVTTLDRQLGCHAPLAPPTVPTPRPFFLWNPPSPQHLLATSITSFLSHVITAQAPRSGVR